MARVRGPVDSVLKEVLADVIGSVTIASRKTSKYSIVAENGRFVVTRKVKAGAKKAPAKAIARKVSK